MERPGKGSWFKHIDFFLLDLICLEIAYVLAFVYRHGIMSPFSNVLYRQLNVILLLADFFYVVFRRCYQNILRRRFIKEGIEVAVQVTTIWLVMLFYIYITKQAYWFSRTVFLVAWGLSCVLIYWERIGWKRLLRRRMVHSASQPQLLILATEEMAAPCIRRINSRRFNGFQLKGIVLLGKDGEPLETTTTVIEGVPVICRQEELLEYVRVNVIDEVFVMAKYDEAMFSLCRELVRVGIKVHISVENMPEELPNKIMEDVGGYAVVTSSIHTVTPGQQLAKRLMDILGGLAGTVLMGLVFLFVAPMIYKASPGPIFFKQERIGKNGRRFKIYKFRSMYMDAEERKKELMKQNKMQGLMFKMDNDPRIIGSEKGPGKGIGNFIRRTSIDELPQFLNVLKGDMSLVGTRPPTVDEYEQYEGHHKVRLSIKPGITGMWQVSGRSEITDFEEVVRLDEEYIQKWSLKLDLKIIAKTVEVVVKGRGAE